MSGEQKGAPTRGQGQSGAWGQQHASSQSAWLGGKDGGAKGGSPPSNQSAFSGVWGGITTPPNPGAEGLPAGQAAKAAAVLAANAKAQGLSEEKPRSPAPDGAGAQQQGARVRGGNAGTKDSASNDSAVAEKKGGPGGSSAASTGSTQPKVAQPIAGAASRSPAIQAQKQAQAAQQRHAGSHRNHHGGGNGGGPNEDSLMKRRVFVGNLAPECVLEHLQDFIEQKFGPVILNIISDKDTQLSKGYGFATFATEGQAQQCMGATNIDYEGRNLNFGTAKRRPLFPPHGGHGRGGNHRFRQPSHSHGSPYNNHTQYRNKGGQMGSHNNKHADPSAPLYYSGDTAHYHPVPSFYGGRPQFMGGGMESGTQYYFNQQPQYGYPPGMNPGGYPGGPPGMQQHADPRMMGFVPMPPPQLQQMMNPYMVPQQFPTAPAGPGGTAGGAGGAGDGLGDPKGGADGANPQGWHGGGHPGTVPSHGGQEVMTVKDALGQPDSGLSAAFANASINQSKGPNSRRSKEK